MLWFSRDIPGLEVPQVFLSQLHPGAMRTNWKILEKRVNFSCRMREHELSVCRVKGNWMQRSLMTRQGKAFIKQFPIWDSIETLRFFIIYKVIELRVFNGCYIAPCSQLLAFILYLLFSISQNQIFSLSGIFVFCVNSPVVDWSPNMSICLKHSCLWDWMRSLTLLSIRSWSKANYQATW